MNPNKTSRRHSRPESGQALVIFTLLLSVLLGFAALAIDFGSYALDRRDLQNAADAIALAAAQELPSADAATSAANTWQIKNGVSSATMNVVVTQQNLPSVPNPQVKVTLTDNHSFVFAKILGIGSKSVSATATAVKTSPAGIQGGGGRLMPWSVTQAIKNSASPGTTLVLKYDSNNVTNGNFGALRIDGNGNDVYRDSIKYGTENGLCASGVSGCGYPSVVSSEPGNMVGGTRTGTDYRIDNADTACDTWDEAIIVSGGKQMLKAACNPFTEGGNPNSLRIIIVPVIESLCNGACDVTVLEFALFFLEGHGSDGCTGNDCEITGRFISSNTNLGATMGVYSPSPSTAHFVRLIE